MEVSDLLPYVSALAIGLLIGFERERSHPPGVRKIGGSRTFALVAVCGALAASLEVWVVVVGLAAVAAFLVVGYRRTSLTDPGTTTEIALFATYLLGALSIERTALAAAIAIIITVLLASKERIHSLARSGVSDVEFEDALKFAVIAFVVLPLVPDRDIGPYGAINPYEIWLLVVAFTGISWIGHILVRLFGDRRGLLAAGLAGGFVSASATTATMGRRARLDAADGPIGAPVGGALLASVATFVQLEAIMMVADRRIAAVLWPAALLGAIVVSVVAVVDDRSHRTGDTRLAEGSETSETSEASTTSRPFALRSALILAVVLTTALLVGRWAAETFGVAGVGFTAAAAGLADAHAGALAAAQVESSGAVGLSAALLAIGAALAANTITKTVLAFSIGGRAFGVRVAIGVWIAMVVFVSAVSITALVVG